MKNIPNKPIPALPFMLIVAQFARSRGLRFVTLKEQMNAVALYRSIAEILN